MEQQQQRIERLWHQTGDLLYANKKQLTRHDKFIGEESDHSPVISCLALPEHAGPPSLDGTPPIASTPPRTSRSDTYLIVQNTLLRHIQLATRFREWLRRIPAPARRFANQQDQSGFRWFLINLWLHAPRSRSLLENDPELTYVIASTWHDSPTHQTQPFLQLDQIILGKRKRLLSELGPPPTRAMLRMIRQSKSRPKQQLIRHKGGGGMTINISNLNRLKITLDQLLPIWPWAWSWVAPYDLQKAYLGADLLLNFATTFPQHPLPPTLQLFKTVVDPDDNREKSSDGIPLLWVCIRILESLQSDTIPPNLLPNRDRLLCFKRLTRCKSIKRLNKIDDEIESLLAKSRDQKRFKKPEWKARLATFPKYSPLENIPPSWTELSSIEQIQQEGQAMNHCLYEQHLEDIADNRMFAYSIPGPKNEKATLTIIKQSNRWQWDQLVGSWNSEPSIDLSLSVLRVLPQLLREYEQTHCPLSKEAQNQIEKFHNDPLISNALKNFEKMIK